jgi:hypothetical protein
MALAATIYILNISFKPNPVAVDYPAARLKPEALGSGEGQRAVGDEPGGMPAEEFKPRTFDWDAQLPPGTSFDKPGTLYRRQGETPEKPWDYPWNKMQAPATPDKPWIRYQAKGGDANASTSKSDKSSVETGDGRSVAVPDTSQIEHEKHWDLNGSLVKLESNGASRRFLYLEPREGLLAVGVTQGPVEFEGTQNGNVFTGTAYVFSRVCGAIGFAVSGYLAQDEQSITLKGDVPYVDKQCRATGDRPGVLIYQLTER